MAVHDWRRVEAGIFHDFHHSWIEEIARALNRGLLPPEYYALREQYAAGFGPDVLTLVRAVTEEKRDARDRPIAWDLRKAATLSRLGDPRLPPAAVALKAADVLHNAQSIARDVQEHGGSFMARFTGTPGETLAFYRGVVNLVDQRVGAGHPLAGEVRAAVEALAATLEAGR